VLAIAGVGTWTAGYLALRQYRMIRAVVHGDESAADLGMNHDEK
jgi:3-methyladenine DNA glycosylase/8-oxoguanine DNA glycosylase